MSCASCATNIETTLKKQPGVVRASVNLASQIATLEFNPSVVKPLNLKEAVSSAGYNCFNYYQYGRNEYQDPFIFS